MAAQWLLREKDEPDRMETGQYGAVLHVLQVAARDSSRHLHTDLQNRVGDTETNLFNETINIKTYCVRF